MPLINWDAKYSVGNRDIDSQHKKLVDIINKLHEAMRQGKAKESLDTIFSELIEYTEVHFADEEELMKKKNYPGLISHKSVHADLVNQVKQQMKAYEAGNTFISMQVQTFLKDWLINHIQGTDKKYMDYLKD